MGALGEMMKKIKFKMEIKQTRANVKRRQGNQRYAVRDLIYAYRLEDSKKNRIRKLQLLDFAPNWKQNGMNPI